MIRGESGVDKILSFFSHEVTVGEGLWQFSTILGELQLNLVEWGRSSHCPSDHLVKTRL